MEGGRERMAQAGEHIQAIQTGQIEKEVKDIWH